MRGLSGYVHLLVALYLLWAPAAALAEVAVVAPADPGEGAAAVRVLETALEQYGLAYRRIDESTLSERTLRPFDLIVLPQNRRLPVEVLRTFIARGGRWVAYQVSGEPALLALLGVQPTVVAAGFAPRGLAPTPRPGMPARVLWTPPALVPLSIQAADPGYEAGEWEGSGAGPSALVRGPYGYYVNLPPAHAPGQAELLAGMLADLEPRLWGEMLPRLRMRAEEALDRASLRWSHARQQPDLTGTQRARIDRALREQWERLPSDRLGTLEIVANCRIAAERVTAALQIVAELQRLSYEMTPSRKGELRGIRFAAAGKTDWEALMRMARDAGLNSVFVRVGSGGSAIYPSEVLVREAGTAVGSDELKLAIETARKYHLTFHACRPSFRLAGTPPETTQKLAAEDRLVRNAAGRQGEALNPADPRNQEQEFRAILELVRKYDLDGVHLEGLGYPDTPHDAWDYGLVSRREFEMATGKAVQQWPEEVLSGPRKREYEDWERENLNRLLQRVYQEVKKTRPHVQVSAAVEGDPRRRRAAAKEDWGLWLERGWLDFVVPRVDAAAPDRFAPLLEAQVGLVGGRIPVAAGLELPREGESLTLLRQVELSRELGADGFVLVNSEVPTLPAHLSALRAGATAEGTWPGYLAPRVEWELSQAITQGDAPLGLLLGDRTQLAVKLLNVSPERSQIRSGQAELRLEDAYGRLLLPLGTLSNFNVRRVRFEAPAGRFRPVVRGTLAYVDGKVRPFVVRGPLCEGLPTEEFAALKAREAVPAPAGTGRKIAVYAGSENALGWLDLFKPVADFRAFPLHHLRPDHLAAAEVLVVSEVRDVAELTPEAEKAVREWVAGGGILLLAGESVGARWHPRMFPEVGVGTEAGGAAEFSLDQAIGGVPMRATFAPSARRYLRLRAAEGAEILAREVGNGGAPVLVAGKVGRGRVFLYGSTPGSGTTEISDLERRLLLALLAPDR